MIQKPSNYDNVATYGERQKLPPGGYILRIMGVKQEEAEYDGQKVKKLIVAFDITDGDYMGFYKADFDAQKEEKRWKGSYRLSLDWDEEWKVRRFKTFIRCLEDSNTGFEFDFSKEEEPQLKGKYFGGIFNRREWEWNGKTGFATQFKYPTTVNAIRNGEYRLPDDDFLESANTSEDAQGGFTAIQDDDIPY